MSSPRIRTSMWIEVAQLQEERVLPSSLSSADYIAWDCLLIDRFLFITPAPHNCWRIASVYQQKLSRYHRIVDLAVVAKHRCNLCTDRYGIVFPVLATMCL